MQHWQQQWRIPGNRLPTTFRPVISPMNHWMSCHQASLRLPRSVSEALAATEHDKVSSHCTITESINTIIQRMQTLCTQCIPTYILKYEHCTQYPGCTVHRHNLKGTLTAIQSSVTSYYSELQQDYLQYTAEWSLVCGCKRGDGLHFLHK